MLQATGSGKVNLTAVAPALDSNTNSANRTRRPSLILFAIGLIADLMQPDSSRFREPPLPKRDSVF